MCFREEEWERRAADLTRELEERDKQHRDSAERLQIQVRGDFSIWNGLASLSLAFLLSLCLSHCLSQIAQQEKKEPVADRENHPVDSSLTGKELCYSECTFSFFSCLNNVIPVRGLRNIIFLYQNVLFLIEQNELFVFGPDWYIPVPDTVRLDSSANKARAQLAQKSKRHPPSRDKLRASFRKWVRHGAQKIFAEKFAVSNL